MGFFVLGLLVMLCLGAFGAESRRRRAALATTASAHGWTFVERDPSLVGRWPGSPFDRGYGRTAKNVLTGTMAGRPFVAFDFLFRTSSTSYSSDGTSSVSTTRTAVLALRLPAPLPRLALLQWGFSAPFERYAAFDAPSGDPTFDQRYRVQVDDLRAAAFLLPPVTRAALVALPPLPPIKVRIEGSDLLAFDWNSRTQPETVEAGLAALTRVADALLMGRGQQPPWGPP